MKVINNEGEIEQFEPKRIKNKIIQETNLSEKEAEKIKNTVVKLIHKTYKEDINTTTIRSLVNAQLVKRGLLDEESKSRKLGLSVDEFENLISVHCKDNANIAFSPESVAKYTYDATAKQYALLTMPKECADAHINGYFHIHDLEYYNTRPNCFTMSLDWVARNGVMVDGVGESGSVAGPAKSLEVLLNHALQVWMALATVLSGGVGFNNFNTYIAPFCKGRSYQEIKQAIQGFIFNCNMSLIARGGQVLFSSIGVDMSVPEVLANEPAISFGGIPMGVYGDYQEEADLVFRAICEVIDEKDYLNRPHRFPNVLFNIRDGDIDKYEGNCKILHDMAVNNPQVYFNNCKSLERSTMGCRSSLPMNYRGNYKEDCCNCGNFMYNTINLPLLALESENLKEFYTKLDYYCELTYKSLLHRKAQIEKVLYEIKMSKFLTQKDKITGEPLYDLHRNTFTIGYCGLNEALIVLTGNDIVEETDLGIEIIEFINQKKQEFFERDGLRWSVIASPAESTAHRFAEIIKQKYPDAPVQGRKDYYYLTNSSHIAVRDNSMFAEHIKNADKFHSLSLGGNILHLWMGEVWSDPEAYWSLNKKILETNTIFWAYSKCYTFCSECQFTINDKLEVCPICGSTKLQVWDRITGYFVPCSNYNNGKLQEFEDRFRHKVSEEVVLLKLSF